VRLAADLANRALASEGWARERLASHIGRTLRIAVGPMRAAFLIETEGRLAASDATPDLAIEIDPLRLPALLAEPSRWSEIVRAEGDEELAKTLAALAPTFPWFIERLLSRPLGPIAGQQLADAGRRLLSLPEYAAQRIGESVARYVGDEARLAVRTADVRAFAADVADLSARIDALAARLDALDR
jgi:ubiquinone biosynthesis protein UbiJ